MIIVMNRYNIKLLMSLNIILLICNNIVYAKEKCKPVNIESKCKEKSDDYIEVNIELGKKEYRAGYVNLDNLRIIIKNISGEEIYIPDYLGYKPLEFDNKIYIEPYIVDEYGNKVERVWCELENCYDGTGFYPYPLQFNNMIKLPAFHFIGYDYKEEKYIINKPGKYYLYVKVSSMAKHELMNRRKKKNKCSSCIDTERIIEKTWQGCVVSKPIEIIVKE